MSDLSNSLSRAVAMVRGLWQGLWRTDGSIAQKSVRGAAWVMVGMAVVQVLQVVQTAILARLLGARDYGLLGLALAALGASAIFSQFGVSQALVQRQKMTRRYMDSAWMLDLIRNFMMFVAAFFVAAPMAAFYKEPQLTLIVRVCALKFVFMGLSNNSGMVMLSREMNFRRLQVYEMIVNLLVVAATVTLGFTLRNVWALVLPQVFYGFTEMVGSYVLHPFRPRVRMYWTETRAIFSFGIHVIFGGWLMFLRNSLAKLLLGKLLGTDVVGYYTLARSMVARPTILIGSVFGNVLYPAFSRLQDRLHVLRRAFLRSMGVGCLALGPVLVGVAVTAHPLSRAFYGPGWGPVVPIAVLCCVVQFVLFLQRPAGIALTARGKPGRTNIAKIVHPLIFVPLVVPMALRWQTRGVVAALGMAAAGETTVLILLACQEMDLPLVEVGRAIVRPIVASALMGVGVWAVGRNLTLSAVPALAVLVPLGVLLYALTSYLVNRSGWADALRTIGSAGVKASGPKLAAGGAENA